MQIDPGWEKHIVAYLYKFQWFTREAILFERAKNSKAFVNANAYTWNMVMNRAAAGADVPAWLVLHVAAEMKLRDIA